MITFIIIFAIVYGVIMTFSNDKSQKDQIRDAKKAMQLPDYYFQGKTLSSAERAANLWPNDKDILDIFQFSSADSSIYLKMKDGRSISCPLSKLEVHFNKWGNLYRFVCIYGGTEFSFYQYDYVFTKEQYDTIINVLLLAGTTHGRLVVSSFNKTLSKVNTAAKVLNKLQ